MEETVSPTIRRLTADYHAAARRAFGYRLLEVGSQIVALICTAILTVLLALNQKSAAPDNTWPLILAALSTFMIGLPRVFRAEAYAKASRVLKGELWLCLQMHEAGINDVESTLNWRQAMQGEFNRAVDAQSATKAERDEAAA